jgi:TolB-like protein/Tfp pilus assembly protein PilF
MSSLISGYEYDIFISYRQKDNKYDGWVTEFVDNLKRELEATFKEDVGVYFDINPHDGLLETHDVDASLREKLNCLIFIPIISRTYCDPRSFAWEHEFKAFVARATDDNFGLKVKLTNGNVASRVLPVRIHDLDMDDIALCESVLEGVLRGVEFIYKEPGVNKPLTSEDDEKKNLNKTKYRIQINKIANAIKEIISGLQAGEVASQKEKPEIQLPWEEPEKEKRITQEKTGTFKTRKLLLGIISILLLAVFIVIHGYPEIFKPKSTDKISIAVMPFQNMTKDTTWNNWRDGIQQNIISELSNTGELRVFQKETISSLFRNLGQAQYSALSPSDAGIISKKLNADLLIYGNIQKAGSELRLNAQLINIESKEVLKSFEQNGPYNEERIILTIDSLRKKVMDYLLISKILKENISYQHDPPNTKNLESFKYCSYAYKAIMNNNRVAATEWYKKALAADSNNFFAAIELSFQYEQQGMVEESFKWRIKNFKNKERMDVVNGIWAGWAFAADFESPETQMKYLTQALQIDDQMPNIYFLIGCNYNGLKQYEKAIPEFEKAFGLAKIWAKDWLHEKYLYLNLGTSYQKTGQFNKALKLYKKCEKIFPDSPDLAYNYSVLFLVKKDSVNAGKYIEKYKSLRKKESASEADLYSDLGRIYWGAEMAEKSEEYLRKALSIEPQNPYRMDLLASFFCDKKRNLDEVPGLIDSALKFAVTKWDYYNYLHTKGWGLYLQGKYQEALAVLQKTWDETPFKVYSIKAHLEEVKKAMEERK